MNKEHTIHIPSSFAKKILCCMTSAALCLGFFPGNALADVRNSDLLCGTSVKDRNISTNECPDIAADYAILTDTDGNVYFERAANKPAQIASVTKIMTAIVALEYDPQQKILVKVTKKAAQIGESSAGLKAGDVMDMNTALKALMISSGNDAAVSIANSVGSEMLKREGKSGKSEKSNMKRFVKAMNETAQVLGMTKSTFENPHGLDFDEFSGKLHSTASDVAIMTKHLLTFKPLAKIVKTHKTTITVNRNGKPKKIKLVSTDKLLTTYKGTIGVKTGFTSLAGSCFAGACKTNGKTLIAIVLHSSDDNQRFTDCSTLWNWQRSHTVKYKLINSDDYVSATINDKTAEFPVVAKVAHLDWPNKTVRATVFDFKQTVSLFDMDGNVSQKVEYKDIHGNVRAGDVVGTITFKQHNEEIATVDMIAAEDFAAPGIFEGIGIWWNNLWAGCNDEPTHADSTLVNDTPLLIDKYNAA